MAALTVERATPRFGEVVIPRQSFKVAASTKIFHGALVVANSGLAAGGTAATGLIALGKALSTVDNSSGAAGDLSIEVEGGVFKFENASTNTIADANVGADCFIDDDQTVSTDSTGKSRAGKVVKVESDGVLVLVGLGL